MSKKDHKTQIAVAIVGLVGVLGSAWILTSRNDAISSDSEGSINHAKTYSFSKKEWSEWTSFTLQRHHETEAKQVLVYPEETKTVKLEIFKDSPQIVQIFKDGKRFKDYHKQGETDIYTGRDIYIQAYGATENDIAKGRYCYKIEE